MNALRLSLGRYTTEADIDEVISDIIQAVNKHSTEKSWYRLRKNLLQKWLNTVSV